MNRAGAFKMQLPAWQKDAVILLLFKCGKAHSKYFLDCRENLRSHSISENLLTHTKVMFGISPYLTSYSLH